MVNKQKKKKKRTIPIRLNILFFVVFFLFSILILRLGVVQIVYGNDYKREIERTEDITVNSPVPRGKMFDRNGKVIVDNMPRNAITYTNFGVSQDEMLKVAERLAELIDLKPDKVQERDKQDYWMIKNPDRAKEKVTKKELDALKEKYEDTKEYNKEVYKLQLDRITKAELNELTDKDLEILAIYRAFSSGYALTPQIVKNEDVTQEEFALVSENLQYLPGVDTTTDWERSYTFGSTLKTVLGKVTDSNEGIPKEELDYYLARDYNRNDRVGKSYLEKQYEDVLHGQKEKVKNITDKTGKVIETKVISEGERGKDLVLTIDMDLQLEVEKIIEEELMKAKQSPRTGLLDRAFVVLMDPNTGDVLTMAGKQLVRDKETGKTELQDFALGTITTSYNVGSTVKGATVLTGYQTGAIRPGTVFYDAPLKIKNSKKISSWKNFGNTSDIRALRVSSNVYMFKTAIEIGQGHYEYEKPLPINKKAFDTMRESFAQFGLGNRTGIDLPNEATGYVGPQKDPAQLLFLAIGQYDTYTPMQLAQYVSTIANGGYRIQPRLVKEIRDPLMESEELGPVVKEIEPKVLNRIKLQKGWMENIHEGFRQVTQHPEGTAYKKFIGATYSPAGKTGTAQGFYDGPQRNKYDEPPEVMNLSFVGYAPHNDPEVAISVVVPWAYQGRSGGHSANTTIARRVLDKYFEMKKTREENKLNQNSTSTENQNDEMNEEQQNEE
ncbi:peptidoglycan D,D-transpeptidase FtsI family protein [Robertmurraya andreesenii]|uniref:Cell division protein FtsI/penicillin-binding protein 2 n=1 Tax=Anoxybacillus andreesenii TaxID=1325932 RepID=A0ABT9V608_9BACL|nr:penicillin-binding protein 2 [Robertmurraya andreesenii]MDQ0156374.1 cell division protein FtsI/penicillin-binding protein 2 [Robertmurraya andreesenii]